MKHPAPLFTLSDSATVGLMLITAALAVRIAAAPFTRPIPRTSSARRVTVRRKPKT